jgi:hypothetical protein
VGFTASRPTPNLNYQGVATFRLVEHGCPYQKLLPPASITLQMLKASRSPHHVNVVTQGEDVTVLPIYLLLLV